MLNTSTTERGDTIIEVLFAFTVFSLVAIAGISLMNQGIALSQRALEIGLVRQQIDTQADALRFLNKAYVAEYGKLGPASDTWNRVVVANAVERAQDYDEIADSDGCHLPSPGERPFALDVYKLNANPYLAPTADTATYAKIRYDTSSPRAEGIWVQAVRSPVTTGAGDGAERPGFYDFHIRACWFTPGQSVPVTIGTIVRLYEPRG